MKVSTNSCKTLTAGLAEVGTRRSPLSTTASKERTMARLLKNSNDDTWAHAQCIKEHTCWAYPSP
jgi:hypothetical protein